MLEEHISKLIAISALLILPLIVGVYEEAVLIRRLPKGRASFPNLAKLFFNFLRSLVGFVHWQEQRKYWGTVFDSTTHEPIDPVLVELVSADSGRKVQEAITDLMGRYGFLAYAGKYKLRVSRSHYRFPSDNITGARDEIFDNLYHGEMINVQEGLEVIAPNIPMDPIEKDFNQEAKQGFFSFDWHTRKIINIFFRLVFWIGFAFAIWNFFSTFSFLASGILVAYLLLLMVGLRPANKRLWGRIINSKTDQPMPGLLLELRVPKVNVIVGKAKTGVEGRFFLKCSPGEYELSVSKIYVGRLVPMLTRTVRIGREGLLKKDIYI